MRAKNSPRSLTQLRTILRKHTVARPVVLPRAVCWLLVRSQAVAGVEQGNNEYRDAKKESHEKVFTHRHPTSIETRQLRCERSIREGGESGTLSEKSNAFAWRETHPPTRRRPPPVRCRRVSPCLARLGRARQRLCVGHDGRSDPRAADLPVKLLEGPALTGPSIVG